MDQLKKLANQIRDGGSGEAFDNAAVPHWGDSGATNAKMYVGVTGLAAVYQLTPESSTRHYTQTLDMYEKAGADALEAADRKWSHITSAASRRMCEGLPRIRRFFAEDPMKDFGSCEIPADLQQMEGERLEQEVHGYNLRRRRGADDDDDDDGNDDDAADGDAPNPGGGGAAAGDGGEADAARALDARAMCVERAAELYQLLCKYIWPLVDEAVAAIVRGALVAQFGNVRLVGDRELWMAITAQLTLLGRPVDLVGALVYLTDAVLNLSDVGAIFSRVAAWQVTAEPDVSQAMWASFLFNRALGTTTVVALQRAGVPWDAARTIPAWQAAVAAMDQPLWRKVVNATLADRRPRRWAQHGRARVVPPRGGGEPAP
jgi:hypothetical protein